MHRLRLLPSLTLTTLSCLAAPPQVDLDGPRVVASSLPGPRSVEISVLPELSVEFSEPIDPATVHAGSVVLAAWDILDERCTLTPICDEGSCERGRCQTQSLSSGDRSALDRGELDPSPDHVIQLDHELDDDGTHLRVRPRRPLDAHRRYTLLISPALRDRGGAPLVDDHGRAVTWQRDFVTADRGSAGPEPQLVAPTPASVDVATNLAHVQTQLWPPVPLPQPDATLELEAEDGNASIALVDPVDCPGWVPGTCLRWRPAQPLAPHTRYRPAGGTLIDRLGRPALLPAPARETWFGSAAGPDDAAPEAAPIAQLRGRCLAIWVDAGELVEATLSVDELQGRATISQAGWIGLELDAGVVPGDQIGWSLELRDLADNGSQHHGQLVADASFDPELARVQITEVLANPSGAEPHAEFVELRAGPQGADLDGLYLADVPLAELQQAWLDGDDLVGDPLPSVSLVASELAIVVASGWTADEANDPAPPPATKQLVVDASIGAGGLKNAGEHLTLWTITAHGPTPISTYANWIDTGASAHNGRSVIAGTDACDLPDRWRSHPQGRSTPGQLP
ncbi:Ig-like domain-containing protein [Enhygromyxa salina]|uniref:Uncharacterized protein n=1 Tax=Enhygromyxa salina TaxID=215803 RepID=A0A2S9YR48_9BACT|nr:Ig-like domain-containing protein [Enhygromyxa salina]PRQ07556.1 hypothetical protein ENSA7_25460 [Enhygromyxa salina]